jgi:hypothetical protein
LGEYGIRNERQILSNQKRIKYAPSYQEWRILSIDTLVINSILQSLDSKAILDVMSRKVYARTQSELKTFSFFLQNNKYHIFELAKKNLTLMTLDNLARMITISDSEVLVYSSIDTFYYLNTLKNPVASNYQVINSYGKYYEFGDLKKINNDTIAIGLWQLDKKRTLLYLIKENRLIQYFEAETYLNGYVSHWRYVLFEIANLFFFPAKLLIYFNPLIDKYLR